MAEISIEPGGDRTFMVTIREGSSASTHTVTVPDGYPEELGIGDADLGALVRASFTFLLEREPKESILRRFDLPVIATYFPEYPNEITNFDAWPPG